MTNRIGFFLGALAAFAGGCGSGAEPSETEATDEAIGAVTVIAGNPCHSTGTTVYTGTAVCSMVWDGATRTYLLHVPASYKPSSGSLVLSFHGAGGSSYQEQNQSGLSIEADKKGFAIAYPQGLPVAAGGKNSFYDGGILRCGTPINWTSTPDDIGFTRQIITTLQPKIKNDPKRVFAHGQSAGAHFVHTLGVVASDLIAAIAPYAETLYSWHDWPTTSCPLPTPKAPVSVLILHGDQDTYTRYCGGNSTLADGNYTGTSNVDASFDYWKKSNGCATVDTNARLCSGVAGTETSTYEKKGSSCKASTEVQFYKLIGGWHFFYPYANPMNQPSDVPYNPDFDATTGIIMDDVIWNFFNTHPKP